MPFIKRIVLFSFLTVALLGCASQKIYEKEFIKERPFERHIGQRDAAILRYGYKGIEERIILEKPIINPSEVNPGDIIRQELKFGLLSEGLDDRFIVKESVVIIIQNEALELLSQESEKGQGVHLSIVQITLPKDLNPGEYQLITTISAGESKKTVSAKFVVR
jgi:hypothetical protein